MADITVTDSVWFRKKKFQEKMKDLEEVMSGRNASILPFVTDNAGKFYAKKTQQLIHELIKDMNIYANRKLLWIGNIQNSDIPEQRAFCKYVEMFLYLVIRVSLVDMGWMYEIMDTMPQSNFQQILDCAEDFKNRDSIYDWAFDRRYAGNIVFENVLDYSCVIYEDLLGKNFSKLIPAEMWKEFEEEDAALLSVPDGEDPDEMEDFLSDEEIQAIMDDYEEMPESETERQLREANERAYKREKEKFVDVDHFCQVFEKFALMLFAGEFPYSYMSKMKQAVEGMLDIFLCEHKLSLYNDTDQYLKAYTYLKKTEEKIDILRKEV